ncbi:MAG: cyanase [Kiloniellales bacterium]|nr:cyanase [Kiloniellales bacterium]
MEHFTITKTAGGAIDRDSLTTKIVATMKAKKLTFAGVAAEIGLSPVFTTAALLGQMALPEDAAAKAAEVLGIPEAAEVLAEIPSRGSLGMAVPTDPLIYRFYEIVQVYGTTLKALIEEEFGDGIMSAIDFDMAISRIEDPAGDRVKVEMTGKFLKYKNY